MKLTRRRMIATCAALASAKGTRAMAQGQTLEEIQKRVEEMRARALANFPFKLIEVPGKDAMSKWQELKSAGNGLPVVLGGEEGLSNLLDPFAENEIPLQYRRPERSIADVLDAAGKIKFPDDLIIKRNTDEASAHAHLEKDLRENPNMGLPTIVQVDREGHSRTLSRDETLKSMLAVRKEPPLGEWPGAASSDPELTIATDILSGKSLDKVYLIVVPTDDWTTIPAHLRWGDWNENPAPEWHVAALRSWRDRYDIELVGLSFDTMNLQARKKPQSRDEAIALAREQYAYCSDIVDQGVGTVSQLAKDLMVNDWWFFWWD
jgi:hypothetical protein